MQTSRPNFEDYRKGNDVFTGLVAHNGLPLAFSGKGEPEQIFGEIVSGDFFSVLGVRPALGRAFLPDEDKVPGASLVTVLSDSFWQRRLGGDPTWSAARSRSTATPSRSSGLRPRASRGRTRSQHRRSGCR